VIIARTALFRGCFLIVFVALLLSNTACGKKGAPKPPEVSAPSPVGQFAAQVSQDAISLSWVAPVTDSRGETIVDLSSFKIRRRVLSREQRGTFETIAEMPVKPVEDIAPYTYVDQDVSVGKLYDYSVVPVNEDGVEGRPQYVVRVKFHGQGSTVEIF
jgi:hypothetical protein